MDDVGAGRVKGGRGFHAEQFKGPGGEDGRFQRLRDSVRGHEQALVEGLVAGGVAAHLAAQAGGGEPGFDALDGALGSDQIRAGGSQPAAGVFNERTNAYVRAEVGRFFIGDKFAITVVHHDENVGPGGVNGCNHLRHFLGPKRRPPGVAPAALDEYDLRVGPERSQHGGHVDFRLVFAHFHLGIGNAHFFQIPRRVPAQANHRFHGVIRRAGGRQQVVAGQQQPEQTER